MEERKSEKSMLKVHKTEKWEIDTVGEFLLQLYHEQFFTIRDEFLVTKSSLRNKFNAYLELSDKKHLKKKFEDVYGPINFGKILFQTDFIINTPRGSDYYRIKIISLFQYRNEQLKEWEYKRMNRNTVVGSSATQINTIYPYDTKGNFIDPELIEYLRVADDAEFHPLTYEGSLIEDQKADFVLSNMGCFICQCNFETAELFENHVDWHGDDSDFESLKELKKLDAAFFNISYTICKGSHYFCFSLNTKERNLTIEKIIIVRSNSFYYVNKTEYDLDLGASDKFFVDSHLFTSDVIQPIVVVFRYKSKCKGSRIVEQHHFWRTEKFPEINFSLKAYRLPYKKTFKPQFALVQYMPPHEIKLALRNEFACESLYNISNELRQYVANNKELTMSNICKVLTTLVQIEDMDGIKKYETLVQLNAKLLRFENLYTVKLKNRSRNMVENILTPYDEVIVIVSADLIGTRMAKELNLDMILKNNDDFKRTSSTQNVFFGVIEKVSNDRVTFSSDKKINEVTFSSDKKINNNNEIAVHKIIFRPARLTLRYQYRAIEYLDSMASIEKSRIFFPTTGRNEKTPNSKLELFNSTIAENPEQYQAVQNIAAGPTKNATYIVFGPPGTGKTTTIVEAILQLYKTRPCTKILVTAGSNSACDEVALRLCKVLIPLDETRAIVRIFAKSNEKRLDNIDEMLIEASNMYGAHFYPDVNLLHEYRIVVCTLSVVGKLSTGRFGRDGLGKGIYTHIFVDEAAASTEAETLVGISSIISSNACVILSGDHKQLGPILQSDQARDLGLDVSLMERLLKRDCYKVDEYGNYNSTIQTRLRRNYRSHPEIVKLYNELYYNAELVAMAKEDDINLGKLWHSSPNPDFPIIFHNVFGTCVHDRSSTSLINGKELEVVMDYVLDLMCYGINGKKIEQKDIGIISPYKKQYLRIQEELNTRHFYNIETGSVETFQGKEKDIIIVSFVRSFTSTLGFLDNPRRLNVTLSRAKSLLILIGNPKTLCINSDFRFIIEKCRQNKTMVGTRLIDEMDKISDTNHLSNAPKNLSRKQRKNNMTNVGSNKKENFRDDKKNDVKQQVTLGKQIKKGKKSQHHQNREKSLKNSVKKQVDIDLLLHSLPDVPRTTSFKASNQTQHNENISCAHNGETIKQSFGDAYSNAKSQISVGKAASTILTSTSKQFTRESNANSKTVIPIKPATSTRSTLFSKHQVKENGWVMLGETAAAGNTAHVGCPDFKIPIPLGRATATGGTTASTNQPIRENKSFLGSPISAGKATATGGTKASTNQPIRENLSYFGTPISIKSATATGGTTAPRYQPIREYQSSLGNPISIKSATATGGATTSTYQPIRENQLHLGNPNATGRAAATGETTVNTRQTIRESHSNVKTPVKGVTATETRNYPTRQPYSNSNSLVDQLLRLEIEEERNRKLRAQRFAEEEAHKIRMSEEAIKKNKKKKESSCLIS